MIVDLTRSLLVGQVVYDTIQDTLTTADFGVQRVAKWSPHPSHTGLLIGTRVDVHMVRDEYDDPGRLVAYDRTVSLKLLRASLEPRWSPERSTQLHAFGALFYEGIPDMGQVHSMAHAITYLGEWLDAKQLKLFGR